MISHESREAQRQVLINKKALLEGELRDKFRTHRELDKHKPGVRALSKQLRRVKAALKALT